MAEQEGTMSEYVLRLTDALVNQAAPMDKSVAKVRRTRMGLSGARKTFLALR